MSDKNEILINRMYSGYDLDDKLGHEAINLITDKDGKSYIYVLSNGMYTLDHFNKIGSVVLVRGINKNCVQVLGVATDLEPVLEKQVCEIWGINTDNNNIPTDFNKEQEDSYDTSIGFNNYLEKKEKNDVRISFRKKLFKKQIDLIKSLPIKDVIKKFENNPLDKEELAVYITFMTDNFKIPKEKLYLVNGEQSNLNGIQIDFESCTKLSATTLHTFISDSDKDKEYWHKLDYVIKGDFNHIDTAYKYINNVKDKNWATDFWKNRKPKDFSKIKTIENNLIKRLKQVNNECMYSNMVSYYLTANKRIGAEILNNLIGNPNPKISSNFNIYTEYYVEFRNKFNKKESGRIDILIIDKESNSRIIIENKIKSKINGLKEKNKEKKEYEKTQLSTYYDYFDSLDKENEGDKEKIHNYYFVLRPVYNNIDNLLKVREMNTKYKEITYEDLYLKFKSHEDEFTETEKPYFMDFLDYLYIHSKYPDEYNAERMLQKFK